MPKSLFNKGLVFGLIILFIGVSVIPVISGSTKTINKVVNEDVTNDRIEDINGYKYDNKGFYIILPRGAWILSGNNLA